MFILRDCTGAIVGRANGYKKHSTVEALIKRHCSVRRAVYDAFFYRDMAKYPSGFLYSIKWED